jgi:hypothetical protein
VCPRQASGFQAQSAGAHPHEDDNGNAHTRAILLADCPKEGFEHVYPPKRGFERAGFVSEGSALETYGREDHEVVVFELVESQIERVGLLILLVQAYESEESELEKGAAWAEAELRGQLVGAHAQIRVQA